MSADCLRLYTEWRMEKCLFLMQSGLTIVTLTSPFRALSWLRLHAGNNLQAMTPCKQLIQHQLLACSFCNLVMEVVVVLNKPEVSSLWARFRHVCRRGEKWASKLQKYSAGLIKNVFVNIRYNWYFYYNNVANYKMQFERRWRTYRRLSSVSAAPLSFNSFASLLFDCINILKTWQ